MRCPSRFGPEPGLAQCEREAGHRPQTWHRYDYEDDSGGYVMWQFTEAEREE